MSVTRVVFEEARIYRHGVDLNVTYLDHPAAANQTFLVSDGEDLSTTALLQRMALALDRPARLIPISPAI